MELEFEEVVNAYFDCHKGKRNTIHAQSFEFHLEKNLFNLYQDLISGQYKISQSIAFVVEQPKVREIWAGTFRDRIVHHIIYNRLSPRFYPSFIRNSFACIPERGVLDGSDRLWSGMRSITRNWNESCYYLQGDVRNFFVSIDKEILFSMLIPKIQEPWLTALVSQVIFHDPRTNCILKSKRPAFDRVPRHKSLMNAAANKGLPIGNLTSQFFANVYLDALDTFTAPAKPPPDGVCHEALPEASDVRTLPEPWVPSTILIEPLTSSFSEGVVVPIPTAPPEAAIMTLP